VIKTPYFTIKFDTGNPILDTDSYKASHWLQYPAGARNLFNYLESRGGSYDKTVFFGLQYLLRSVFEQGICGMDIRQAEAFFSKHGLPFNKEGWEGLLRDHGGKFPLRIKALPEGSVVPTGVPLLTVEATDPKYFWLVGWTETMIMRLWYPITVATLSYTVKQTIKKYLNETADDLSGLPFKLHDFGSRGVSSRESAAIGGAAHLVNFMGSDTVVGVVLAHEFYGAEMAGFSIPAAEHSTITSWGKEHEAEAYENMLTQFAKPGAIVAVVSDSYDIYNAVNRIWGEQLRQKVIDSGATLVVRPDSGNPVVIVNELLHLLDARFGSKLNSKGYRVLNNVRIIQGDGLNPPTIEAILKSCKLAGYSADNVAFGMGGGLLQQVNRDTLKFAYKCSAIQIDDPDDVGPDGKLVWRDVYKDPVTDPGKKSKRGRIGTKLVDGKYVVCPDEDPDNLLQVVFENGQIVRETTFDEVRARAQ
jgi:nicotinamide phosphoribosyltransferase